MGAPHFAGTRRQKNRWGRSNAYTGWLADRRVPQAGVAAPANLPPELHHSRWCGEARSACIE